MEMGVRIMRPSTSNIFGDDYHLERGMVIYKYITTVKSLGGEHYDTFMKRERERGSVMY